MDVIRYFLIIHYSLIYVDYFSANRNTCSCNWKLKFEEIKELKGDNWWNLMRNL